MSKIDKPTENWTKFPNCILDNIDKYTPIQFKVLALMVRKNLGYQRPNRRFALTYIQVKTGIKSKTSVGRAVKELIAIGAIKIANKNVRTGYEYQINWVKPAVHYMYRSIKQTASGPLKIPLAVHQMDPVLDTIKRNKKKKAIPRFSKDAIESMCKHDNCTEKDLLDRGIPLYDMREI